MHPNHAALSAGRPRAISAALLLLLGLLVSLLPGCANPHETPETLFTHLQELNLQGRSRDIWLLYTDDERERQGRAWDEYREFLRRNPGDDNVAACRKNFRREPAELARLTHVEMFELANEGNEQAMVDARITHVDVAPDLPNGKRVDWVTAHGQKLSMLTQYVDDGWYLVTLRE